MISDLCCFSECGVVVFSRFRGSVFIPVAGVLCTQHGKNFETVVLVMLPT
jgi:membrane protein DedA with SNARE-associated domain